MPNVRQYIASLEAKRQDWVDVTRKNDFQKGINDLLAHQYSKKTHFIFELLQNAEDAEASSVCFRVNGKGLIFSHNGKRKFDAKDVEAITSIGKSNKDYTQIGKHGIGFKAVFAYTHRPIIYSGTVSFAIDDIVVPRILSPDEMPGDIKSDETRIFLPFDSGDISPDKQFRVLVDPEKAMKDIEGTLQALDARSLLFLRSIETIQWSVEGRAAGSCCRETRPVPNGNGQRAVVLSDSEGVEKWMVFDSSLTVESEGNSHKSTVEVAFLMANGMVVQAENTPLVVYFPTEKQTDLGFLVHGPFITTKARDNIPTENSANMALIEGAAELAADSLPFLRHEGRLSIDSFDALPLTPPSDRFFLPLYDRIREAMQKEELLPAAHGGYVAGRHAKIARRSAELVRLVSDEQLSSLFNGDRCHYRWVSTEITESRARLHEYLIGHRNLMLGTRRCGPLAPKIEVRPEDFIRLLSKDFLEGQTLEWTIELYRYLRNQRGLWKELKKVPLVRLNDGTHVEATDGDGNPHAYFGGNARMELPTVHPRIAKDADARGLLEDVFGYSSPDVGTEVLEAILPRYRYCRNECLDTPEHANDLKRIADSLIEAPVTRRKGIEKAARDTPFVIAENAVSAELAYKVPPEVYFPLDELQSYFAGCDDAWLMIDADRQCMPDEEWESLGVSRVPRRVQIACPEPHTKPEYSTSDNTVYDYELEGLREFWTVFKGETDSERKIELARSLWTLLHLSLKADRLWFSGLYKWFYYTPHSKHFPAQFAVELQESQWLPCEREGFHAPSELCLEDLPKGFERDNQLADILFMRSSAIRRLAEECELNEEDLRMAKMLRAAAERNPSIRKQVETILQDDSSSSASAFPTSNSTNPERRAESVAANVADSPTKTYAQRSRSVRTSAPSVDPKAWLREQYTNEGECVFCQMCEGPMPFQLRDRDEDHFEKAQIDNLLDREFAAFWLCLCPTCASKYRVLGTGIANGRPAHIADFLKRILNYGSVDSEPIRIRVDLGREMGTISFVETHFLDLQSALPGALKENPLPEDN